MFRPRAVRFDFRSDPELASDPWAYMARLCDKHDIFFSPDRGGYWVVTPSALIDEVFSRHGLFTATSLETPRFPTRFG